MTELDAASARKLDTFVQQIHSLRREVRSLQRATPARHTSVDSGPGMPVTVTDLDGTVIERIEPAVVAPVPDAVPPTPAAPEVEALAGVAVVSLSGLDLAETLAPTSVVGTRVYASLEPGFVPSAGSLRIASAPVTGEVVLPVTAGVWHVRIEWVTRTGTVSAPSAEVVVDLEPLVDTDDIAATLQTARDELAAVSAQAEADLAELDRLLSTRIDTETGKPLTLDRLQPGDAAIEVLDSLYSQLAVVHRLTALTAWIGGTMIGEGQIVADHIVASERMSAKLGEFLKVRAGQIEANAFEGQSFTGGIFTGPVIQSHADPTRGMKLTDGSLKFFEPMEESDGTMTAFPSFSIGTDGQIDISSLDPATGIPRWQISQGGDASFETVSSNGDPTFAGSPLIGALAQHPRSEYGLGILDQIGWGEVAPYISREDHSAGAYDAGEHGLLQTNFTALPGRRYRVHADAGHLVHNGTTIAAQLRFTNNGSEPSLASPILGRAAMNGPVGAWRKLEFHGRLQGSSADGGVTLPVRVMLSLQSSNAFGFVSGATHWRRISLSVEDVGPIRPATGYARNISLVTGSTGGGTDATPPPSTRSFQTSWSGTGGGMAGYFEGGGTRVIRGSGASMMKVGRDPHWAAGGIQSSLFWLGPNAVSGDHAGRTMTAATAGAVMDSGYLSIRGEYSPPVSGGTAQRRVHIYGHGHTSAPAAWRGSSWYIGYLDLSPSQRLDIPIQGQYLRGIQAGNITGFGFYTTSSSWGDAHGVSWEYKPTLTLEYSR